MRLLSNKTRGWTASAVRRMLYGGLLCGLMLGVGGCRHKTMLAPLPAIQAPVDLVEIPLPENLSLLETPAIKLQPTPIAVAATRLPRERRRSAQKTPPANAPVTAPTQTVVEEQSPETAAIGALTAGGEANPQTKQAASELIATIEKKLIAQPAQNSEEAKAQVNKVRNFWRDAQEALKSGDAEGAMTLATKAKLLLDDMEK